MTATNPTPHVLVLRTSNADLTSFGKFQWPESGPVSCPDWDPRPRCGNGLHGLLWGDGDWSLLNNGPDAKWQVVRVEASKIVEIDNQKVKFPSGEVIFTGDMASAMALVLADKWHIEATVREITESAKKPSGDSSTAASSGNYSKAASSGDSSKAASSGYSSKAASSGYSSKAASSGDSSKAASSGYSSKAASSGDYSTAASSGDYSTAASSGDYSTAAAEGKSTIAMAAGVGCIVSAGENGCFATAWYDEKNKRNRISVGYVGRRGIKANTPYRLTAEGKYKEVNK